MISFILAKLFPPKLGRVENFGPSVTRHLIETGAVDVIEADEGLAFNALEWPDGRWAKPRPIRKIKPPQKEMFSFIK